MNTSSIVLNRCRPRHLIYPVVVFVSIPLTSFLPLFMWFLSKWANDFRISVLVDLEAVIQAVAYHSQNTKIGDQQLSCTCFPPITFHQDSLHCIWKSESTKWDASGRFVHYYIRVVNNQHKLFIIQCLNHIVFQDIHAISAFFYILSAQNFE